MKSALSRLAVGTVAAVIPLLVYSAPSSGTPSPGTFGFGSWALTKALPHLVLSCSPNSDLLLALKPYHPQRYDQPSDAVRNAPAGATVLLLAENYPERGVQLSETAFAL